MTLLKSTDIETIAPRLKEYDASIIAATGSSLLEIACLAAGIDKAAAIPLIAATKVASVPMTSGEGKIIGFAETLTSIAQFLGFQAETTSENNISGLAEAYQNKADIVLTADDDRFVAIHTQTRNVADNNDATGKGFVFSLERLTDGLEGKHVLVLGCGPVGQAACMALMDLKASITLFEIKPELCHAFINKLATHGKDEIHCGSDLQTALKGHKYIIDATPAENIIDETVITPDTYIAAPGVPCGLNEKARSLIGDRLIHDTLQIGVATMLLDSLKMDPVNGSISKETGSCS